MTTEEADRLAAILEEKRAEDSARRIAQPGYPSRFAGRVQTTVCADPRAKAIFEARLERRRLAPEGPIRYLGFETTATCRVFRFGRLPPRDSLDLFEVRIAHCFFGPRRMSLQEGPGFCIGVLTEKNFPPRYEATEADIHNFAAKKSVRPGKR
jgi:hypothetical protein